MRLGQFLHAHCQGIDPLLGALLRLGQFLDPLLGALLRLGQFLHAHCQGIDPLLGALLRLGQIPDDILQLAKLGPGDGSFPLLLDFFQEQQQNFLEFRRNGVHLAD